MPRRAASSATAAFFISGPLSLESFVGKQPLRKAARMKPCRNSWRAKPASGSSGSPPQSWHR
eukprot:10165204-Alexandrium_andersonii.AAC.1